MPRFFAPGSDEHMEMSWFSCLCEMGQRGCLPPCGEEDLAEIVVKYGLRLPPHWTRPIVVVR